MLPNLFSSSSLQPISLNKCKLLIHIFHLNEEGSSTENLDVEDEHIVAANHWLLPTGISKNLSTSWLFKRTRFCLNGDFLKNKNQTEHHFEMKYTAF